MFQGILKTKSNISAAGLTLFLHAALILFLVIPVNNVVIAKQVMRVSFVAPSSSKQIKSQNNSEKSLETTQKKKGFKQKKNELAQEQNLDKQNSVERKTSGKVDPNAVATNSIDSEPVFDAEYLDNPAPFYPRIARRQGQEGKVLLDVVVDEDGKSLTVTIIQSSGHKALDDEAVKTVRNWKFVPARRDGKLVQANVIVPIEFKLV